MGALWCVVVSKYGKVCDDEIARIVDVMQECYSRLVPHEVSLVDLYLFERSSSVEAFFAKERSEVGVATAPFDELFFATHDAWRGIPRITLCLEKMEKLPEVVKVGGIRHEVGHTILHGSLQYYILPLSPALLEIADRFNLSSEYVKNMLYLVSIAVKDYEVTRLLYQRGYVEDQVAYAKFLLKVSEDDMLSWKISQGRPLSEALYLISCLKVASCAAPLLTDKEIGKEIRRSIVNNLSYLPTNLSNLLLKIIEEEYPFLGTDTLNNIDHVMRKCNSIFDSVKT
ncbi:MAG: hypothetical protein QXH37_02480 [Candidatus Bathyarchaeia archaeon]